MKRGRTGQFVLGARVGGETVRAFVPNPLPPHPAIELSADDHLAMERALLALGRLDSVSSLLPDPDQFLYLYVRREAVLSSRIEGTQSSLSDLLLYEIDDVPGVLADDAREVSNYVAALDHGLRRVRNDLPISGRLLREVHSVLMRRGRGSRRAPGEFRTTQNWIGGSRPGDAAFVPPPAARVAECMTNLERFIHGTVAGSQAMPLLVRAALAHVQFETIHPFLDGNGRVGRLLITLLLCAEGILREPLLYLSLHLKRNRAKYYELLQGVRDRGDFETWIRFFVDGVERTASEAVETARTLALRFEKDQERVRALGRSAGSVLQVLLALKQRPVLTIPEAARRTGLSAPTVNSAFRVLGPKGLGIAKEITGRRRGRAFGYDEYLRVLGRDS